jgi:hypothetical protein
MANLYAKLLFKTLRSNLLTRKRNDLYSLKNPGGGGGKKHSSILIKQQQKIKGLV